MAAGGAAMAWSASGNEKGGQLRSISVFVTHDHRGAKITTILLMLPHHTPRALCGGVKKNTDSPVKGMILFAQGEGGGGKVMVESAPPVSPWSACFLLLLVRRIFSDFF